MVVSFSRGLSNACSTRGRLIVVGVALALLVWLSNSFGLPIARAGWISPAELVNPDGTLNLNGNAGMIDVHGWSVQLDPQRGPVFAPNAPTANAWSALGRGVDDAVFALAVSGSDVYVGGYLTQVCGDATCDNGNLTVNHIAKWSSATGTWSALGKGVDYTVYAIAVSGSDVFVGGMFTKVCGNDACDSGNVPMNYVARWNGSGWSALGKGVDYTVYALAVSGNDLYAGGMFTKVCGNDACDSSNVPMNHVARWNAGTWSPLGSGVSDFVLAIAVSGSDVFVGGGFTEVCGYMCLIGNTLVNRVAKWSKTTGSWYVLGKGVDDTVHALAVSGSNVYIGGSFTHVCSETSCNTANVTANRVARWNGTAWFPLSTGLNYPVFALAVSGSDVYVGGDFTQFCSNDACSSGIATNHIVRWNGAAWFPLVYGVNSGVGAFAVSGLDVYAGGYFSKVCDNPGCTSGNSNASFIAKYGPPAPTPTPTPTSTGTPTPTSTPTATPTSTPTATPTSTPTATPTSTPTATPTSTPINSCIAKPAKPKLTAPANGASIQSKVTLKWSNVACETKYQVRVKNTATNKVAFKANPGADVSKIKTSALAGGTTYKWYVQACNALGCVKSAARSFHVP